MKIYLTLVQKGPAVDRARIDVVAGKRYRFRLINTSAYSGFTFSIENHPLTIIEVRGPFIPEGVQRSNPSS